MESSCLVGVEFSFHKTERIWRRVVEMEARALPPPTCARKHGYGGNFYMVFFFATILKIGEKIRLSDLRSCSCSVYDIAF